MGLLRYLPRFSILFRSISVFLPVLKHYVKTLCLGILFTAIGCHTALAQKNFRPGYVVRLGGDTLRGEVDVRGQQRMARQCLFRPGAEAPTTLYQPADLKAYGLFAGARYEAFQVPAPSGSTAAQPVLAALFMQVLAEGKARLYTFTDESDRMRYYFRQASGPITELVQLTQMIEVDNRSTQEVTYPFRQVLSQSFADCAAVQHLLVKAELTDSQLTAIFNRYNTCANGQVLAVSAARSTKVHLGFVMGAQRASLVLNDGEAVNLQSALRPVVGVGLLINPASFNSKLAVRVEALYQMQRFEGQYQRKVGTVTNLGSTRDATIVLNTLRVPLLLRYTLPAGKVRPYLQAGGEASVLLDSQAQVLSSNEELDGTRSTSTSEIILRKIGFGLTAGVGLLIPAGAAGAVQLEGRINQMDNVSSAADVLSGPTTISVLVGYTLGR